MPFWSKNVMVCNDLYYSRRTAKWIYLLNKNSFFPIILIAGLDKIEFLQSHNIRDIYQKAFCIIEHYFSSEEEEDVRVAPSANNNQYQFNADQSVPMGGFQF